MKIEFYWMDKLTETLQGPFKTYKDAWDSAKDKYPNAPDPFKDYCIIIPQIVSVEERSK